MQIEESKSAGRRNRDRTLDERLPMQIKPPETEDRHPKQRASTRIDRLDLHLLAVKPELGRGRRRHLHWGGAVVKCCFRVQRKKEHQSAEC